VQPHESEVARTGRSGKNRFPGKARRSAEFLFDAQKLIVLRDAIGARSRAGLDLASRRRHREISDEGIFGLARPVRND